MIQRLIAGGHAYVAEGHVLFHVPSMANYGQLSGRNRDDMVAGARVAPRRVIVLPPPHRGQGAREQCGEHPE